jgi:hypothetical protein
VHCLCPNAIARAADSDKAGNRHPHACAVAKAIQVQPGTTGIFLFNQSAAVAQVVVSETIATILPQQTFLFVLPPQDYELKIYRSDHLEAINRTETVSAGKTRFVYLMP